MNKDKYSQDRLKEILSISAKYVFDNRFKSPRDFRLFLEELGASFVKIGQILSTRLDLLPKEYTDELRNLQDNVAPGDFSKIERVIQEDLNDFDEIFIEFNKTPIASASLAEVFRGKLYTGEDVVIKVQRPGIRDKILADLKILSKLAPFINLGPTRNIVDMKEIVGELESAIDMELNFELERKNISKFMANNENIEFIKSPKVFPEYCSDRILVMEYISGIKIDENEKLIKEGYDLKEIAEKLTYNYFQQVFDHGFFHADPHPGNILIHEKKIGILDFGLMGTLDKSMIKKLNNLLEAVVLNDITKMTKVTLTIGIAGETTNIDKLERDIKLIYDKYIDESIYNYDISLILNEFIELAKDNDIKLPKEITLLAKGMLTIQGVISNLDREISIMEVAMPYFKNKLLNRDFKDIDTVDLSLKAYASIDSMYNLPIRMNTLLDKMIQEEVTIKTRNENIDRILMEFNKGMNKLAISLIILGLLISASLIITIPSLKILAYLEFIVAGLLILILFYLLYKSYKE